MRFLSDVFYLGLKEFASLRRDNVMLALVVYSLSIAVVAVARGVKIEVANAAVAIVDQDRSAASQRLADAIPRRYFKPPVLSTPPPSTVRSTPGASPSRSNSRRISRPTSCAGALAGHRAEGGRDSHCAGRKRGGLLAGNPAGGEPPARWARRRLKACFPSAPSSASLSTPNLDGVRFNGVMQVINSVTILSILLVGSAVMREREHGTLEHLLVMPVSPASIALAKIWANGLVILAAVFLSLQVVLRSCWRYRSPDPCRSSWQRWRVYLFATTSLGILLATIANSMPQFALLAIPVFVSMMLLSGTMTPLESMPQALQTIMHASPSIYFVRVSQAILYRGAGWSIIWQDMAIMTGIGMLFLTAAISRFRSMLAKAA